MSIVRNTRVLVVEDDYLVSEMVKGLLEEIGCSVIGEATSGLEAIEITQLLQPDVVLMDVRMPDLNGIDAAQCIHERCPTPVVVLTAYETPELVEKASKAGVGAYLLKPPNARAIERAISIAVARFEDMMELRGLTEDLRARNAELDAFAHTVAHDIQGPLSLIVNSAEILRKYRKKLSNEELEECIRAIEESGLKISRITNQLLMLSKARKMDVEMNPLDMASIVAEAQGVLTSVMEQYQARVILPETWPVALGYAPWIEIVWVNYLSNAIKYGGHAPRVELGADPQPDGMVRFWVRDNGPGLTQEEQDRLFKPFTQLGRVDDEGHGLGLSIVQRIVKKLGGEVGVESEEGQGSLFTFTLPAAEES